jgi:hypothetical protein
MQKEVIRREPVRMVLAAPSTNDAEMGERKLSRALGSSKLICSILANATGQR